MLRQILLSILLLSFLISVPYIRAAPPRALHGSEAVVLFEDPLETPAREVAFLCSQLKSELRETLGWELNLRPTVILVRTSQRFQKMAGNKRFVAFAVPRKQLIVIDHSKMNRDPFSLGITLKHELCHLLLHHHIRDNRLPKWLDEGVAQWVSDGLSELIMAHKRSVLDEVILSGNYIPIRDLEHRFPRDSLSLQLAYEESKSFVTYIKDEFGEQRLLALLGLMKEGDDAETAIQKTLSVSLDELEREWHSYLKRTRTWFVYLAIHLYDILFFAAALIGIAGFIKVMIKRRRTFQQYDEEDDEHEDKGEDAL